MYTRQTDRASGCTYGSSVEKFTRKSDAKSRPYCDHGVHSTHSLRHTTPYIFSNLHGRSLCDLVTMHTEQLSRMLPVAREKVPFISDNIQISVSNALTKDLTFLHMLGKTVISRDDIRWLRTFKPYSTVVAGGGLHAHCPRSIGTTTTRQSCPL